MSFDCFLVTDFILCLFISKPTVWSLISFFVWLFLLRIGFLSDCFFFCISAHDFCFFWKFFCFDRCLVIICYDFCWISNLLLPLHFCWSWFWSVCCMGFKINVMYMQLQTCSRCFWSIGRRTDHRKGSVF